MAIATGTALAIGFGVNAGLQYLGGRQAAKAAKDAAAQQQAGVREARAYAEPLYQQALQTGREQLAAGQAGLAPYAQQGGQSLTALSALLGLPAAPAGAPASKMAPAQGLPLGQLATPTAYPRPSNDTMRQVQQATGMSFELALERGLIDPQGRPTGAAGPTSSSYVTLRAPNGQTRPVPADQAEYFLARGATRV